VKKPAWKAVKQVLRCAAKELGKGAAFSCTVRADGRIIDAPKGQLSIVLRRSLLAAADKQQGLSIHVSSSKGDAPEQGRIEKRVVTLNGDKAVNCTTPEPRRTRSATGRKLAGAGENSGATLASFLALLEGLPAPRAESPDAGESPDAAAPAKGLIAPANAASGPDAAVDSLMLELAKRFVSAVDARVARLLLQTRPGPAPASAHTLTDGSGAGNIGADPSGKAVAPELRVAEKGTVARGGRGQGRSRRRKAQQPAPKPGLGFVKGADTLSTVKPAGGKQGDPGSSAGAAGVGIAQPHRAEFLTTNVTVANGNAASVQTRTLIKRNPAAMAGQPKTALGRALGAFAGGALVSGHPTRNMCLFSAVLTGLGEHDPAAPVALAEAVGYVQLAIAPLLATHRPAIADLLGVAYEEVSIRKLRSAGRANVKGTSVLRSTVELPIIALLLGVSINVYSPYVGDDAGALRDTPGVGCAWAPTATASFGPRIVDVILVDGHYYTVIHSQQLQAGLDGKKTPANVEELEAYHRVARNIGTFAQLRAQEGVDVEIADPLSTLDQRLAQATKLVTSHASRHPVATEVAATLARRGSAASPGRRGAGTGTTGGTASSGDCNRAGASGSGDTGANGGTTANGSSGASTGSGHDGSAGSAPGGLNRSGSAAPSARARADAAAAAHNAGTSDNHDDDADQAAPGTASQTSDGAASQTSDTADQVEVLGTASQTPDTTAQVEVLGTASQTSDTTGTQSAASPTQPTDAAAATPAPAAALSPIRTRASKAAAATQRAAATGSTAVAGATRRLSCNVGPVAARERNTAGTSGRADKQ
jgi:hypothetical protein